VIGGIGLGINKWGQEEKKSQRNAERAGGKIKETYLLLLEGKIKELIGEGRER